jgi:hypothetical protein
MPDAAAETLLLRPSLAKRLVRLASCALFTFIGVMMIRDDEAWGWLVLGFFGLGAVLFTLLLIPGAEYLRLTAEGFELRSLWRTHRQRWDDIAAFHAGRIARNAMVLIDYAPTYTRQRAARRFSAGLAGTEGALPDTYGRSAESLAELLNEWRRRYSSPP